ncbi:flagellin, partial [Planktomarina temperata]|nr:flagellin [Planktomarina temperata]
VMTVINTNTASINAQYNLNKVNQQMEKAMEQLSSGKRINSAADDAAGLAISTRMESQIKGLEQAMRNAADGQSLIDTTEGAHTEITNILQRMRELAIQAVNDTNVTADRANLNAEVNQLTAEIDRIAGQTTWNGVAVLDGTFTSKSFQIGAEAGQTVSLDIDSVSTTQLGSYKTTLATEANDVTSASVINGDTLAVTGHLGSANATYAAGASAKDIAAAINADTSSTGVSATATTMAKIDTLSAAEAVSFTLNGTAVASSTPASTNDLRNIRDAINAVASSTGVTATVGSTNAELVLTAIDGRDIAFTSVSTATAGTDFDITALNADGDEVGNAVTIDDAASSAVDSVTVTGYVELSSMKDFSFDGSGTTTGDYADADANLSAISALNISTSAGAQSAITAIDGALEKISQARSDLGAVSNRLDHTISNLGNIQINIEASQSRIQDADFAKATGELTKSQIMSQAATAMLAQANASKQGVLSLLQG